MMYDIGIIGGGTAGLTAAIYGQRAGKRTLVIEGGAFGGQITTSPRWKIIRVSPVSAAVSFP